MGFAVGEVKEVLWYKNVVDHGRDIVKIYFQWFLSLDEEKMATTKDKKTVILSSFFFSNFFFSNIYYKKLKNSITFYAWSFPLVHSRFLSSRDSKTLPIDLSRNRTMAKGHLPWSDFMVHGVNRPLDLTRQVTVRLGHAIIFPLLENESPVTQM